MCKQINQHGSPKKSGRVQRNGRKRNDVKTSCRGSCVILGGELTNCRYRGFPLSVRVTDRLSTAASFVRRGEGAGDRLYLVPWKHRNRANCPRTERMNSV